MKTFTLSALRPVLLLLGLLLAHTSLAATDKIEPALRNVLTQQSQADFLIQLTGKADLAGIGQNTSKAEKGKATVAALQATASANQDGVSRLLDRWGVAHKNYWIANVITARGTLANVEWLAQRADVSGLFFIQSALEVLPPTITRRKTVTETATRRALADTFIAKALGEPEPGLAMVHAPEVWALGFTGQGVVVGDHDIGVQWDHPALKKKYRGWNEATQAASHDYNWLDAFGALDVFCDDPAVPCDPNQHGTHTTGTMVGDDGAGNKVGVAPGAQWMACRSLLDPVLGVGTVPTYLDCMQWMLAPYPTGDSSKADTTKAPDVVNNSWGCVEGCAPPVLKDVNDATIAAGIMQVVSAGNDGQGSEIGCSTLAFPLAVYESSFTVGANNVKGEMADFTSLGPVLSDGSLRIKPNISGPGVSVRSSVPGNGYDSLSGTSMSGPHVAGVAALIMSAEPRLIGRVMDVRTLIERTAAHTLKTSNTASSCGDTASSDIPNNIFGYGLIDALAAVKARPQLLINASAPGAVAAGTDYPYEITVQQPAEAVLEASNVQLSLPPPAATVKTVSEARDAASSTGRDVFKRASLKPGETWTVRYSLAATDGQTVNFPAPAGEADQISVKTGNAVTTVIGSAAAPAGSASTDGGRFGSGAMGFAAWLPLLAGVRARKLTRLRR